MEAFAQDPAQFKCLPQGPRLNVYALDPSFVGYSVGRWDADTLVVETVGFKDQAWLDMSGLPHSEKLKITERIRRDRFGHLAIQEAIDDPEVFARRCASEQLQDLCGNMRGFIRSESGPVLSYGHKGSGGHRQRCPSRSQQPSQLPFLMSFATRQWILNPHHSVPLPV